MDDDPEVIRQQMEETRSSLTDKIEQLEQAVTAKVQNTSAAVTDTVDSVREAVQETVESMKGSVTDTVESVKETFNVPRYFREHPWASFAAAVGAGFLGERLIGGMPRSSVARGMSRALYRPPPPSYNGGRRETASPPPTRAAAPSGSSWMGEVASKFDDEIGKLKGMAIGTAFGLLRDFLNRSIPANLTDQIGEIVDSVTRKLGGQPMRGNLLDSFAGVGGRGKTSRERDAGAEARAGDRAGVV
jgi:ElaB/YqjD/DUF883 family membrane-anchored ribosome-binding protein